MRAVDVECFAGAFTYGVATAGFEVIGKRELPGGFGVPSVAANQRLINANGLEIQVGSSEEWVPLDVDLVFGNPPCSAFSGVSDKNFAGADNSINDCMWALVEYAARCNGGLGPPVVAYESVGNAYTKGRALLSALLDRLRERTGAPYALYHVLHNAYALGGCAERRRYFWVASRIPIGFEGPPIGPLPTLWDAIGDLYDVPSLILDPQPYGEVYGQSPSAWAQQKRSASGLVDGHVSFPPQYHRQSQALLDLPGAWQEGESLTKALKRYHDEHGTFPTMENERDEAFAAHYGPDGRDFNFGGAWQPERWRHDRPARVVTGGSSARSIHPFAPRPLTLREMFRIQGFPDDWQLKPAVEMASANTATLWPGKGIPVESGRWIATMAHRAIEGNPANDGRLEQVAEHEWTWNGTNDHKPKAVPKRKQRLATKTEETKTMPSEPKAIDPVVQQIMDLFTTGQQAQLSIAGLEAKEAKKVKELMYTAAYKLGGKVSVATDKAAGTATGTFRVPTEEELAAPKPTRKKKESPLPVGTTKHDDHGVDWTWDGAQWVEVLGETNPELFEWPTLVFDDDPDGVMDVPVFEPLVFDGLSGAQAQVTQQAVSTALLEHPEVVSIDAELAEHAQLLASLAESAPAPLPTAPSGAVQEPAPELKQPKNSAREVKDRRFDLTQLRSASHGYYVHRDYAAHYFRWGWAARQIQQGDTLLEVGCGQDLPLTRVMIYYPGAEMPKEMVCVDLNKIKDHVQPQWLTVYDETNFMEAQGQIVERHGRFNVVTCFEVIEHMPKEDGQDLLVALAQSVADDGMILLSTPVFNGKAAANHIHEWTIPELAEAIEQAGLVIEKRWGTFASYHDVKRGVVDWLDRFRMANAGMTNDAAVALAAQAAVMDFYENLREFYSDDVLANFMAPNIPDYARNNVWRLRRKPAPHAQQHITRVAANKFTWGCPRCGTEFVRTSEEPLRLFIPSHLDGCDGTPPVGA